MVYIQKHHEFFLILFASTSLNVMFYLHENDHYNILLIWYRRNFGQWKKNCSSKWKTTKSWMRKHHCYIERGDNWTGILYIIPRKKYNIQKYIKITLCLQNIIRLRINKNHKNTNKMIAHIRRYITQSKLHDTCKFYRNTAAVQTFLNSISQAWTAFHTLDSNIAIFLLPKETVEFDQQSIIA